MYLPQVLGMHPQERMKESARTLELAEVPKQLSLSYFLSPSSMEANIDNMPTVLTLEGKQLDSTHLVLLALNEECRNTGRGAFYHLPLRSDGHEAHACDLIYLPDGWNDHDTHSWDNANWAHRLKMCTMSESRYPSKSVLLLLTLVKLEGRIEMNEDILPICVRILQFDEDASTNRSHSHHRSDSGHESRPSNFSDAYGSLALSMTDRSTARFERPVTGLFPTTQHDPAIKPSTYSYSRPMEDISTYLILYTSHRSTPVLCPTAAFEHQSLCKRGPTPGDFSETFYYGPEVKVVATATKGAGTKTENAQQSIDETAAKYVMSSGMSSNRELVERMWTIWHEENNTDWDTDWLGRLKYSWQEVKSIIDGGRLVPQGLPDGWPVSE